MSSAALAIALIWPSKVNSGFSILVTPGLIYLAVSFSISGILGRVSVFDGYAAAGRATAYVDFGGVAIAAVRVAIISFDGFYFVVGVYVAVATPGKLAFPDTGVTVADAEQRGFMLARVLRAVDNLGVVSVFVGLALLGDCFGGRHRGSPLRLFDSFSKLGDVLGTDASR